MRKIITLALITILLGGCAGIDTRPHEAIITQEFNKLASWVELNTNYDPYSNEIHIDNRQLSYRYSQMLKNINYKVNSRYHGSNFYKDHYRSYPSDWRCQRIRNAVYQSNIGEKWYSNALTRFVNNGYVLTQKGYPQGNLNFGSYSIPVTFLIGLTTSNSSYAYMKFRRHTFSIKKNVPVHNRPVNAATSSTTVVQKGAPTVPEKIKQLKSLLDEGLITKEEFSKKKAELLNEF